MKTQQNGRYALALTSDITCIAYVHSPGYMDFEYVWLTENEHYIVPILKRWRWLENGMLRLGTGSARTYLNRIPILHFTITKNARAHKRLGRPIP